VSLAGVRRSGLGSGLRAKVASAKGTQGGVCMLTEGLVWAGAPCRVVDIGVRRWRRGGARGEG
jgi:hypothetical protein